MFAAFDKRPKVNFLLFVIVKKLSTTCFKREYRTTVRNRLDYGIAKWGMFRAEKEGTEVGYMKGGKYLAMHGHYTTL